MAAAGGAHVSEPDTSLIARSLSGDEAAFGRLYAAHAARVRAAFLRMGFPAADAEDLAQGVFVRVFRSLGTFDAARGRFGAWLATIVRNVARRAWSRRPAPQDFDPLLAEETLADPGDNPGDDSAAREEAAAVRRAVAELPPELGEIVRLRYVESRTTRGIAAATGLPESTVRLRLDEARGRLAQWLRARGIVE